MDSGSETEESEINKSNGHARQMFDMAISA